MATRSTWRDDSTSFDIDVDSELDLDATTPVRSFDVRAAFDFDQTVANPDHPLITAEREIWNRERARESTPLPVLAPMPSIYAVPQRAAPRHVPATRPSTHPESHGSLAPTAMEVPQSYFRVPTPASGVKAPPLSIVSSATMHHAAAPMFLEAQPARRLMSPGKIAVMCGALAVAAAVAAFTVASGADSGMDPNAPPLAHESRSPLSVQANVHNAAAAPQPETTAIPTRMQTGVQNAAAPLPPDMATLLAAPTDPSADWRVRLTQGQGSTGTSDAKR